jgi:AcrR family transcriptional regulator
MDRPNDATDTTKKPSPRERLLKAMAQAINQHGYPATAVAHVISNAGVSRSTFYEHFKDKDDCFLATYRQIAKQTSRSIRRAAKGQKDSTPIQAGLQHLLHELAGTPALANILFIAPRAAHPLLATEHDPLLAELERLLTNSNRSKRADTALDLPPSALLGAIRMIAIQRLANHAHDRLPTLLDDLVAWANSYQIPKGQPHWSTSPQAVLRSNPPLHPKLPLLPVPPKPPPLPRGPRSLPETVVTRNQRERLFYATVETAAAKGYATTTVAQIAAAANLNRRVLYEQFTDKEHATLEAQRQIHRHALSGVSTAYFLPDNWPQQVFNALLYLTTLIANNHATANLVIVEPFAIGQRAMQSLQDLLASFSIFLQDGYHQASDSEHLPRLYSEATIGGLYELIYRQVTQGNASQLPRYLPQLAYVAIAPFCGAQSATHTVDQMASG